MSVWGPKREKVAKYGAKHFFSSNMGVTIRMFMLILKMVYFSKTRVSVKTFLGAFCPWNQHTNKNLYTHMDPFLKNTNFGPNIMTLLLISVFSKLIFVLVGMEIYKNAFSMLALEFFCQSKFSC
jgi:hypothetical protein